MAGDIDIDDLIKILSDSGSFLFFCFASLFMISIFVLVISIFLFRKNRSFYNRRDLFFNSINRKVRVLHEDFYIPSCFFWPSNRIYKNLGLDSLVLLKTTRLFIIASVCVTLMCLSTVLPANISQSNSGQHFLIQTSIHAIPDRSNVLVIHLVLSYFISAFLCVLLNYEWRSVVKYRQEYFVKDPVSICSLLFSDLRTSQVQSDTWEKDLTAQIRKIAGESEEVVVYVLRDVTSINKLLREHDTLVLKRFEVNDYSDLKDNSVPLNQNRFSYSAEGSGLADIELQRNYDELKQEAIIAEETKLRAAIVIISNVCLAQTFRCTSLSIRENHVNVSLLPEPTAIIWHNLEFNTKIKKLNNGLVHILAFIFIVTSSIPFAITASLKNYLLSKYKDFFAKESHLTNISRFCIETLVQIILIQTFLWVQHRMFRKLSTYENHVSYAAAHFSMLKKMCIFNAINTFFIYTFSSSYLTFITELFSNPLKITVDFASRVPIQSNFYMVFLSFQSFIIMPWILIKGDDYLYYFFMKIGNIITKSPKIPRSHRESRYRPFESYYIYKYSYLILAFGVGLVFVIISPMIFMVWIPYFLIAHVIFCYDEERNNLNTYSYGGRFWPIVSNAVISYLILMQVMLIGMFLIKHNFILLLFMIPNIVFTISYSFYIRRRFEKAFKYPTYESLKELRNPNQTEISKHLKRYHVDAFIPPINVTTSDHLWEYILEREVSLRTFSDVN